MSTIAAVQPDLGLHEWLARVVSGVGSLVDVVGDATDAARIEVVALLEQLVSAATAAQAAEMVRFADSQLDGQRAAGVRAGRLDHGTADQLALACRISPAEGSRRLRLARALVHDLPETLVELGGGRITSDTARQVADETDHLDSVTRREVEHRLHACDLTGYSSREIGRHAPRLAYEADPVAAGERGRRARGQRRVTLRRARDTMAMLTGVLPAEQGVACWEALNRYADSRLSVGDERCRGQILADTLVERVTGQVAAPVVPVEVNLVVPVETLIDAGSARSGELSGYGPMPAEVIRDLFTDTPARRWWRRVFTAPAGGVQRALVGGDSRRRRFPSGLATLIGVRDQLCRDPYCSAPIRQLDHIRRYADGGPTTLANGRGVCVRGNLVRELPNWQVQLIDRRLHITMTTTPTGHRYRSQAPQPP